MGRVPLEAEAVIRRIAGGLGSPVISVREAYGESKHCYPETNLEGEYQRWNAATAVLAANALPESIRPTAETIKSGLLQVNWPGRWERAKVGGRPIILDASHNPEGASVLRSNLSTLVDQIGRKPVVVTGVLGAPRAAPLLEVVAEFAREIHLVIPKQERACGYVELEALVPKSYTGRIVRNTVEEVFPAVDFCTIGDDDDTIVVTGSIYLLGEVLSILRPEFGSNEGRLQDF